MSLFIVYIPWGAPELFFATDLMMNREVAIYYHPVQQERNLIENTIHYRHQNYRHIRQ